MGVCVCVCVGMHVWAIDSFGGEVVAVVTREFIIRTDGKLAYNPEYPHTGNTWEIFPK